ncbi:hypothetical protein NVV95_16505 [Herbiconiux sp. CPCC 205716]|uniref:Uncharacterized protein n=1 Tax=Herbiconiux gentiana TaxID=2970912 RepID=A0ABT2GMJ3_9MICO|nr:hypothetical protein [Herbiconiux gentiana]MCS5716149.1 hypothetical protein [Herbiconiux gentiana]
MTGPDLDPQLAASMRRVIIQNARSTAGRRFSLRRIAAVVATAALVAGVTAAAVAVVIAGVPQFAGPPAALSPTETSTPSPTPTPTPPTPTITVPTETPAPPAPPLVEETPTPDLVAGYDARTLWDLCIARGQDEFPGAVATSEYDLRFVQPTPDGVPEVTVGFDTPDDPMPTGTIWICRFGGDPAAPTLDFFTAKDI